MHGIDNLVQKLRFLMIMRVFTKVEVISIGDFNCDWFKQGTQSHVDNLKDVMELYQFEQQIKELTRATENTSTLIDLAFTNKAEIIVGVQVHHVGISDHSLICITRKLSIPRGEPKMINIPDNTKATIKTILQQIYQKYFT